MAIDERPFKIGDVFGMGTNALVRYNLRYFFNDIHVLNQKPIYPEVGILI